MRSRLFPKAMKVVLVMSTALDKSIEHTKWQQPLGIAYIAACVRDISDVSIIDCEVDEQYAKTLIKEIDTDDQLIVGFSANTYSYPEALRLAELVKEHNPEAHINFGGYHVTPLADLVLKNRPYIDSVIRGDGEVPFRQLVLALSNGDDLSKVGSLTYRNEGKIVSNPDAPLPDLDSLPYPARDLLPMEKYFDNFKRSDFSEIFNASKAISINATRGCPNRCGYCSIFNKCLRLRSPTQIVDEVEWVVKEYKSNLFYLIGDNLNLNGKWLLSICNEIIKREVDVKWAAITANPENIDEQLVYGMKRSGCKVVLCGFESGSNKILSLINKRLVLNDYKNTVRLLHENGIAICGSFILGISGENGETLAETVAFIRKSALDRVFMSILAPLPGTEIYEQVCLIMPELKQEDIIPMDTVKSVYNQKFCGIDYFKLICILEEFMCFDPY